MRELALLFHFKGEKLKHRETEPLATKQWRQDSNPGKLAPDAVSTAITEIEAHTLAFILT